MNFHMPPEKTLPVRASRAANVFRAWIHYSVHHSGWTWSSVFYLSQAVQSFRINENDKIPFNQLSHWWSATRFSHINQLICYVCDCCSIARAVRPQRAHAHNYASIHRQRWILNNSLGVWCYVNDWPNTKFIFKIQESSACRMVPYLCHAVHHNNNDRLAVFRPGNSAFVHRCTASICTMAAMVYLQ